MDLAKYIDHTFLKPTGVAADIEKLCQEAKTHQFAAVCVHPCWVTMAKDLLRNTGVKVATVVGFPLGASTIETKYFEASKIIVLGADEVDMVINIGKVLEGDWDYLERELKTLREATDGYVLKVIIETAYLNDDQIVMVSKLIDKCGADFVKTSTGFAPSGAKVRDIALIRSVVSPAMGIKASGGIRTAEDVVNMLTAGATRIGASAGVQIVSEL